MPVTINVNNLTLCHKGSGGIATATVPDVCKTPPGPVPIPYPNVAMSSDLAKGTTTVKADGGHMCANYGSEFSKSTGDEAGVAGGVVSGVITKEATWISYSFDVKLEGKGACRLTDKMFMNHSNTVCLAGLVQQMLTLGEIYVLCKLMCECIAAGNPHQKCVSDQLDAVDNATGGLSPAKAEVPYDMRTGPKPLPQPWAGTQYQVVRIGVKGGTTPGGAARGVSPALGRVVKGQIRIPDVALVNNPTLPPSGSNLAALVEMKMPGDKGFDNPQVRAQIVDYANIAAGNNPSAPVVELDAKSCGCQPGKPEPVLVPDLQKENERLKQRVRVQPPSVPERVPWRIPAPSPVVVGVGLLALGVLAWATGVGAPAGTAALAAGLVLLVGGVPVTPGAFKT
jgi:hypothetical protein